MPEEIFESSVRTRGDLGCFLEADDETSYFYLYDLERDEGQKVIGAIRVCVGRPQFRQADVVVCWDKDESRAGLFIRGELWAVFNVARNSKHGGGYGIGARSSVPLEEHFSCG